MNKGGNAKSLRPFVCHSLTNKGMEIFFFAFDKSSSRFDGIF